MTARARAVRWTRRAGVLAALALLAAGCSGSSESAVTPPSTSSSTGSTTTTPNGGGAVGSVLITVNEHGVASGPIIDVAVDAPAGASEMQLSFDPSFGAAAWIAVEETAAVEARDTGYQTLFARFRSEDGEPVGDRPALDDVVIDPTWDAATSSDGGAPHQPSYARRTAPDSLVLRIETGRVVYGGLGQPDQFIGRDLEGQRLDDAGDYLVTSDDDARFADGVAPTSVSRVSRPTGLADTDDGRRFGMVHDVHLTLPLELLDVEYTVTHVEGTVVPGSLDLRVPGPSPSVQANQIGYRPADPKTAYLSAWTGPAGGIDFDRYDGDLRYDVIDEAGQAVLSGTAALVDVGSGERLGDRDLTGAPVWALPFGQVQEPGTYRVCVDGVGCSGPITVGDEGTWSRAATAVARGLFHQRSGIELGPPYTTVDRPRPYHPDDGFLVLRTEQQIINDRNGPGDERFDELQAGATTEAVPDAWGGHFDAGDWDRRVSHLHATRYLVELVSLFPEWAATVDLNIPESGDAVPDLLDEGLWSLDLFVRLQNEDGSVPGGIEAEAHPEDDSASWTEELQAFVYTADVWATYVHAGVAAQAAAVLDQYDAERAARYRESALDAMAWAEAQPVPSGFEDDVNAERSTAAAALFALTGDDAWEQVFIDTTPLADGPVDRLNCHERKVCDAAWIYLTAAGDEGDPQIVDAIRTSFAESAALAAEAAEDTAYGWAMDNHLVRLIWGLGPSVPSGIELLRAHLISGDERLLDAAVSTASFSLGANPLNTTFVTGLGQQNPRYPLVADSTQGGLPVWPGTPVYGLFDFTTDPVDWFESSFLDEAGAQPAAQEAPYLWSWWDLPVFAGTNEFTVFQNHAVAIYTFGILAALDADAPPAR